MTVLVRLWQLWHWKTFCSFPLLAPCSLLIVYQSFSLDSHLRAEPRMNDFPPKDVCLLLPGTWEDCKSRTLTDWGHSGRCPGVTSAVNQGEDPPLSLTSQEPDFPLVFLRLCSAPGKPSMLSSVLTEGTALGVPAKWTEGLPVDRHLRPSGQKCLSAPYLLSLGTWPGCSLQPAGSSIDFCILSSIFI